MLPDAGNLLRAFGQFAAATADFVRKPHVHPVSSTNYQALRTLWVLQLPIPSRSANCSDSLSGGI